MPLDSDAPSGTKQRVRSGTQTRPCGLWPSAPVALVGVSIVLSDTLRYLVKIDYRQPALF